MVVLYPVEQFLFAAFMVGLSFLCFRAAWNNVVALWAEKRRR